MLKPLAHGGGGRLAILQSPQGALPISTWPLRRLYRASRSMSAPISLRVVPANAGTQSPLATLFTQDIRPNAKSDDTA